MTLGYPNTGGYDLAAAALVMSLLGGILMLIGGAAYYWLYTDPLCNGMGPCGPFLPEQAAGGIAAVLSAMSLGVAIACHAKPRRYFVWGVLGTALPAITVVSAGVVSGLWI